MATRIAEKGRDAERTAADILAAAQHVFAIRGYADAKIRDITAMAGANPALVSRYFGGKLKLYAAALDAALDARLITDLDRATFGETIVARFVEDRTDRVQPLPIMMSGASDTEAREVARTLLHDRIFAPLSDWFGGEAAMLKAARFMIVSTGFFAYRDQLPLDMFGGPVDSALREWLISEFQAIVDTP
ncbi:MAG: TetR family transcriptional regulator [Parasphingopyxis sp.]|uniref:TetR/AcrR family transcriptional regulator n=1 Tax=Parasphingopyxis sp. TaxID=1920299 RepID=UPI0032EDD369